MFVGASLDRSNCAMGEAMTEYTKSDYQQALDALDEKAALAWIDLAESRERATAELLDGFNWRPDDYKPNPVFNTIRSALRKELEGGR